MDALTRKAVGGLVKLQATVAVLLFLPAWTLRFWQAWVFWAVFGISVFAITLYFLRNDRRLVENRIRAGPGAESRATQKKIQLAASILACAVPAVSGIDHRLHWSAVPWAIALFGNLLVALSMLGTFFVFQANSNAFATVKVEASQPVISIGPYAVVRHPLYFWGIVEFVAVLLALGSFWALLVSLPLCGLIIARLLDEERFLRSELPGYQAYCDRVRFRLVPFLW